MFLFAWCEACDERVLPYRDLDPQGELVFRCLRCDAQLEPTDGERALRFTCAELFEMGYQDVSQTPAGRACGASSAAGACGGCPTRKSRVS